MIPTQGSQYTIVDGDTLSDIAARAYGIGSKWPLIYDANQTTLKSGDPDLIFPGEIIIIPVDPDLQAIRTELETSLLSGEDPDNFILKLGGLRVPVVAGRCIRTMDTAADGWSATIAWKPGDSKSLDALLLPYSYAQARLFLGNNLLINGLLYGISPEMTESGLIKNLEGWSYTADAIDSTIKPQYEYSNMTLKQIATSVVRPLGIKAVFDADDGGQFDRATAEPGDTIFTFLNKLASQRGLLVSSTPEGNLQFLKADTTSQPVGVLEETQPLPVEWKANYDGRKRFNAYRAIGQSPGGDSKNQVAKDDAVPRSRFLTFKADETTAGNIKNSAEWRRSKQLADALTIPFPVSGWYAPNGELWKPNTLVTVKSKTIDIPDGFDFLINRVEYVFESSGISSVLSLVPPEVYTGKKLASPWSVG